MPAERDPHQGLKFIYSNFYQLYRQGKKDLSDDGLTKGVVLHSVSEVRVVQPDQTHQWSDWAHSKSARLNLRDHLKSLREAKARLKFLSEELEDILKR